MIDADKNNYSYLPIAFPSVVPPILKTIIAKLDIGSSQDYFKNYGKGISIDIKPATNQVVNTPNQKVVTYSFKGQMSASSLIYKTLRYAHVLKDIHNASLISLGEFCYYGCTSILDKKLIHVIKGIHLVCQ